MTLVDNPLEVILRLVEDARPGPWRPLAYVQATGSNPEYVRSLVEMLRLEGVIEVGPGAADTGPEVRLTPLGKEVLESPELLARLREGRALRPDDPGAVIREALRHPTRSVAMPVLVALNVAVFLYCLFLAKGDQALMRGYLMEMPPPVAVGARILHPAGGVTPLDVMEGKWWRLLTACFVHAGLLHIGMNMYTLYAAGRFVEQAWGWWRFLLIYFISGWGGSCFALAMQPVMLVGASGAICGVLGAEGVWILLYGRYLPREMARRGRSQLVVTIVLMVIISILPGISWAGHLGGAVTGAVAALVLHFQRFGPRPLAWLGVLLLVPIPVASYYHLQRERGRSERWQAMEEGWRRSEDERKKKEADKELDSITRPLVTAVDTYRDKVRDVLREAPAGRGPEEIAEALKALDELTRDLQTAQRQLEGAAASGDPEKNTMREFLLEYVRTRLALFEAARGALKAGGKEDDLKAAEGANDAVKEKLKEAGFVGL